MFNLTDMTNATIGRTISATTPVADNTIILQAAEGRKAPILLPSNVIEALGLTPTVKSRLNPETNQSCSMYARTMVVTPETPIEGVEVGTSLVCFFTEAFILTQGDETVVETIKSVFKKDKNMSIVNTHSNGTELRTGTKVIRQVINELFSIGDGEIVMEVALLPENAGFYIVGVQEVAIEETVTTLKDEVVEETVELQEVSTDEVVSSTIEDEDDLF